MNKGAQVLVGLAEAADDEFGLAATVLTANMARAQWGWRTLPVSR